MSENSLPPSENGSSGPFFQTWAAWLGGIGVGLGLVLALVALVTGQSEGLPAAQPTVVTGLLIALGSAVSAVSYRYLRTIVLQVAGGVTALAGLGAVIGPFMLDYPFDSVVLVVSVLVGVVTASLTGFGLLSASPIDDADKPLKDIFAQGWRGWAGMPGMAIGLLLLALAFLAGDAVGGAFRVNLGIVGVALAGLSGFCAFGYGRVDETLVQLSGWLTILVGFWAVISAFVLRAANGPILVDAPLFLVTVLTGLLTVLTAAYAMLTTPTADGSSSLFDITTFKLQTSANIWSWRIGLGGLGSLAGLVLLLVGLTATGEAGSAAGQNAVFSGLLLLVSSIMSTVAYSYGRTLLGQVAGGVTAFVGIWAVISPFLLNYPQNSTLFLVSVLLGAVTAALAGYAITLGDTLRMQEVSA
jgi:hypothetical protein